MHFLQSIKTSHYGSLDFDVPKILMTKLFSYERAFLPIAVSFENIYTKSRHNVTGKDPMERPKGFLQLLSGISRHHLKSCEALQGLYRVLFL